MSSTSSKTTRPSDDKPNTSIGDRPWNDPGPKAKDAAAVLARPTLRALILDFSSVNNVDVTCVQTLIDVRNQLDRYAAPHRVQWHFAHIHNRWTKRALAAAGFGYPTPEYLATTHKWKPIFSVAALHDDPFTVANKRRSKELARDVETGFPKEAAAQSTESEIERADRLSSEIRRASASSSSGAKKAIVEGVNRPFFHVDLTTALHSAMAGSGEYSSDS